MSTRSLTDVFSMFRGFSEAGVILCAFLRLNVDSVLNSSVTCLKLAEQPFGRLCSIGGHSKVPRR